MGSQKVREKHRVAENCGEMPAPASWRSAMLLRTIKLDQTSVRFAVIGDCLTNTVANLDLNFGLELRP